MNTISTDELAARLERSDRIRLIDVLSPEHFEQVHLPGAENIPLEALRERAPDELQLDEPIVVYCSGPTCRLSPQAAHLLDELGYREVFHYQGGIAEWRRSRRPLVRHGVLSS